MGKHLPLRKKPCRESFPLKWFAVYGMLWKILIGMNWGPGQPYLQTAAGGNFGW